MRTPAQKWFEIQAKDDGVAEVCIYDEIGGWGITASAFISALKATKAKKVNVRMNTPGGSVFDGLAIYNYLKGLDCTIQIDGIAASIGSVIAMAGKKVCCAANGFLMIHNPSAGCAGTSEDMRETADVLDKLAASLAATYAAKTGKTVEECAKWMDEETWFSAQEAQDAGLVDEIGEPQAFAAKLDKFSKVPTALQSPPAAVPPAAPVAALPAVVPAEPVLEVKATSNTETQTMKDLIAALADAGFVNAADSADEGKLVAAFKAAITAKLAEAKTALDAKEAELTGLRAQVDTFRKADATAKVNAALAAGKVKADAVDAWVAKLLNDKDAEALLTSLPDQKPAGVGPVKAKVTEMQNLTGLARALAAHRASYDSDNQKN